MKYNVVFFLIISVCFMSGCQFNDIDKRFFVVEVGIDPSEKENAPYKVMVKLAIPSAQVQQGKSNFQIISEDGNSISEALTVIQSKIDKKLDFGHCRIIVINKNLLHNDQLELMKWFIKRPDVQGIAYVAVGKPSAQAVLSTNVKSETLPGNALVLALDETTNKSPYVMTEILNDYYMRLREDVIDPYLPIIEPIKGSYRINKAVMLNGRKIKAELNRNQTRLLNELINPEKTTLIDVGGKNQFYLHAEQTKVNMKIHDPAKGKPYVDVQIKIKGFIEESKRSLHDKSEIAAYEKRASREISSSFKKFLEHLQKLGVDPLGLELKYQAKNGMTKNERIKWKHIYKNLEFHVKSDVKIKGTGTMY